jgi:hypothetical protein
MRESKYQRRLILKLEAMFPGCVIMRNDPRYVQGIPDILILYNDCWAMLEAKIDHEAPIQPNQEYYVDLFNRMSFASFIYPEIEEDVLHDLQRALRSSR